MEVIINDQLKNKVSTKQFQLLVQKDKQFVLKSQFISIDGFELIFEDWNIKIGNLILNNNKFKGLLIEIDYNIAADTDTDTDTNTINQFIEIIFPKFKLINSNLLNYFKFMSFI